MLVKREAMLVVRERAGKNPKQELADRWKARDRLDEYTPRSDLEQRPPMDLAAPLLHGMLDSAMVMGYATGSVGSIETEQVGDFEYQVRYDIKRKKRSSWGENPSRFLSYMEIGGRQKVKWTPDLEARIAAHWDGIGYASRLDIALGHQFHPDDARRIARRNWQRLRTEKPSWIGDDFASAVLKDMGGVGENPHGRSNSNRYSPGPWDIHGEVDGDYYVHAANRVCNIPIPSGYYQSPAEREANARLIASSPRLLEFAEATQKELTAALERGDSGRIAEAAERAARVAGQVVQLAIRG